MDSSASSFISLAKNPQFETQEEKLLPSLDKQIQSIFNLGVEDAVSALNVVLPGLQAHLSQGGCRTATHTLFSGSAPLNKIGTLWIYLGQKCYDDDASPKTRLIHYTLLAKMRSLYKDTIADYRKSKVAWFLTEVRELKLACRCCIGSPEYCIPAGERWRTALMFKWHSLIRWWPEEAQKRTHKHDHQWVTVEQLRDAVAREEGSGVVSDHDGNENEKNSKNEGNEQKGRNDKNDMKEEKHENGYKANTDDNNNDHRPEEEFVLVECQA